MKELTKIEEILLVAIWRLKDRAYGVEIRKYVSEIIGKEFTYGHLYSALNQLVLKKYLVKSVGKVSEQRMGRPRIYYSITPVGKEALDAAIDMNEKLWTGLSKFARN